VKWLDIYFAGGRPDFLPPYELRNVTPFRQQVMDLLLAIPYGQTVTYGELAKRLAEQNGRGKMSAQAVGQAVGWNPIGIMIPCHRVLGAGGRLTGYAGGIANKKALLRLENAGSFEAGLLQL
ncbi:MAG: methylated-DNA--[protein]-cysteine S-methyltransferase, partial [Anaerovibrio slackiae]